ncbi:hypothetical protein PFICI_03000 [Pestalotiopsis fici W106-1]|uniref:Uncharacterized protein n=1 Tax=Pestalotiopsis fici (strain W106-1 / CGMCC3.15140) TaxID=1229662 RepID=W3XG16_PESFW|nr:uncharacterized protein PFICI_03000 [Pestalotiopsis fici W106-1]ETS84975.1 hypothetical protein PFICI_03000 [Pestalotiopsis fici W106-1]
MAVQFQQDFNNALQQPQGLIGQEWRKDLLKNLSDDESLSAAQELYKAITGLTTQEEVEQTASEWLNRCIQGVCERAFKSFESNVNDWIGGQIKDKEWAGVSYKEWEDRKTELREQADSNQGYHEEVDNLKESITKLKDKIQAQAKEIHEQKEEDEITRRNHADEVRDLKKSHETEKAVHQKELNTAMEQLDQKDAEIKSERDKLENVKRDKAEYERQYDTIENEIRAVKDERDRAKEEMKQAQDAADKLQPVLEREQTQRKEAEQKLEAERKSHEDLKEEIQEAKTRINELERRARRSTSPTESSSESNGGSALSAELDGMNMSSPSTSPTDTSPAASDAGGSREERLRRDYVMPILRQVANHRELKDFEPFEEPVETVDNENKLLATLGALVSHYGYNHVENEDGAVFDFPFEGLQQWLEGKERAAGGAGSERAVADTVTTIQSSFEGEIARLRGLKAQNAEKLDKEINDLKNLNSKLTADQSASEEELKKLRDAHSQAQGQDTDKTNQINDLTQKIAKFNEKQESSSEELKKLQDSRDELENQYKVASQHLDGLKRLNSDLIQKIKSQEDAEKKENEDDQKKKQQQVEALEKEIAELNEKHQKASDAFKALQNTHNELKKQSEGAINDLKNQLSESESQQISELQKQLAELQKELEVAEEDFANLVVENEKLAQENGDKEQENYDVMDKYEDIRSENNDRRKRLQELGTQLADLTAKEESLTKDFNDLKKKHDDLLLRYANIKAENMSKTDEIEDLQKQLEQVNVRQKSLDQELEDLKGNHDQISGDSDAKDKKIEELESTVRRITNNSKKDWVALSRLQHQLNEQTNEWRLRGSAYAQLHEEWKEATALLEEEISDLKKKAETGGNFDDWYQATSILRKEISDLKRKQDETAASYNASKASQQKLEEKNKEHIEKLQEEIAQLKRENNQHVYGPEVTEMQRQMSAKAIKELKGQAKEMEDEIEKLRGTRWRLQERVKVRVKQLKEEEDKVKILEVTNQELIKKNEKLEAEAEDNEELQESRNQLKEAQFALDRVKRKEAQLRDELRKNREQLKEQELLGQTEDQLREALRKSEELLKEKEQLIEKQKQNKSASSDARPVDPDMAARVEIGRLLLRYYRAMQAAIATYKTKKRRMIDEGMALNPGFLEDMDVSLEADRRRLQERLDAARTDAAAVSGPPSDDAPRQQIAILERELEKYGGIINEINAGNTLANEAFEISAVVELSPHAADAERLFDERQKTRAETETETSPGTALTEPRTRGGADALAETCCYCFPCTPCDWLIWVLVASIAFFIFAFVSQQRQKAEWSEANALSRSLYIVDRNYNNPTAWWQIAIFVLLNIKAFYLK